MGDPAESRNRASQVKGSERPELPAEMEVRAPKNILSSVGVIDMGFVTHSYYRQRYKNVSLK